jgi:hypothetical protein
MSNIEQNLNSKLALVEQALSDNTVFSERVDVSEANGTEGTLIQRHLFYAAPAGGVTFTQGGDLSIFGEKRLNNVGLWNLLERKTFNVNSEEINTMSTQILERTNDERGSSSNGNGGSMRVIEVHFFPNQFSALEAAELMRRGY